MEVWQTSNLRRLWLDEEKRRRRNHRAKYDVRICYAGTLWKAAGKVKRPSMLVTYDKIINRSRSTSCCAIQYTRTRPWVSTRAGEFRGLDCTNVCMRTMSWQQQICDSWHSAVGGKLYSCVVQSRIHAADVSMSQVAPKFIPAAAAATAAAAAGRHR